MHWKLKIFNWSCKLEIWRCGMTEKLSILVGHELAGLATLSYLNHYFSSLTFSSRNCFHGFFFRPCIDLYLQENIRRCVCIIYDPSRSNQGVLALKALKLSDSFMDLYRTNNFTGEKYVVFNLCYSDKSKPRD